MMHQSKNALISWFTLNYVQYKIINLNMQWSAAVQYMMSSIWNINLNMQRSATVECVWCISLKNAVIGLCIVNDVQYMMHQSKDSGISYFESTWLDIIMSHLIKICTVCPLVFEFSIWYSLDLTFFWKFADENFIVCFFIVKELRAAACGKGRQMHLPGWCIHNFQELQQSQMDQQSVNVSNKYSSCQKLSETFYFYLQMVLTGYQTVIIFI